MNQALEIVNLSFSYDKKKPVLRNINLSVKKGDIYVLLGMNGCGKSTLIKCIMNFLSISSGHILFQGKDSRKMKIKEYAKYIAYVSQDIETTCDYCVEDFLLMGRMPHKELFSLPTKEDIVLVGTYMREFSLMEIAKTPLSQLSGGERQLVAIVCALVQETPVILLDEPMSALDLQKQAIILQNIKKISQQEKTIIFSSHNPNHAFALNTEVCLMEKGEILGSGNVSDFLTQEFITKVFGENVILLRSDENSYCSFRL